MDAEERQTGKGAERMSDWKQPADPWAPVRHEDAPAPKPRLVGNAAVPRKPTRAEEPERRRAAAPPASVEQPQYQPSMMMGFGALIPPELVAAINNIRQSQATMNSRFDQLADTMEQLGSTMDQFAATMEQFASTLSGGMEAIESTMLATSKDTMTSADTLAEKIEQQSAGQSDIADTIGAWTKTIETAILAPRRVRLERGKDGAAVSAVSEVKPGP